FTNGCFDILHRGHVRYLERARELGDILVVGLNSDTSVRKLKGEGRPVMDEEGRAEVLAALASVSYVHIFSDERPDALVEAVHPDILAKGADYKVSDIAGASFVLSYGGRVELVDLVDGESTTKLMAKIQANQS
ncbi:D-glycero-beta-D-manno-heptose 1-phosphate adenylyltransferase, partial [Myxococcota bacterium]|nr:D-glycero-beta-D-manno-heptose 1-phosphate adenylyltransferase [Myxococcota bacterium]